MNTIKIWAPRYHDGRVLINPRKVKDDNHIVFTKAKHLMDKTFYISGAEIKNCPLESNGKIWCHAVPMTQLHEQLEIEIPKELE